MPIRIGIVTGIRNETAVLAEARAALRAANVDRIVSLGGTSDFHGRWGDAPGAAGLSER